LKSDLQIEKKFSDKEAISMLNYFKNKNSESFFSIKKLIHCFKKCIEMKNDY